MKQQTKTISFSEELDVKLDDLLIKVNKNRILGDLSKSKIIRIAVAEWIDRQERALKILNETGVQNGISV